MGHEIISTMGLSLRDSSFSKESLKNGDGYAWIELNQDRDGQTLQTGKVYGLREIVTPEGTATNGEEIQYQDPHSDNFFCYVFSICNTENHETADYANFRFLPDDIMTIRNTPESIALNLKKVLAGNCTPTDTELNGLNYQIYRGSGHALSGRENNTIRTGKTADSTEKLPL